jgi:hypothetical protein
MHPRRPRGAAAARPRALPWRAAGLIAALAAAAALGAGCSSHPARPAAARAAAHPAAQCGSAKTPANVPVKVEVARGTVTCAEALAIERAYTSAVASGQAPGNGRGPVQVSGWTCQAFTTPVSLKTGDVSKCERSGAEILTVLPPP